MSTFSLVNNFSLVLQTDVFKYIGFAWISCIVGTVLSNAIVSRVLGTSEVMTKPPFRDFKTIQMLYYPLISCIVQPLLFALLAFTLFGETTVRSWDTNTAISFTSSVWFATSFHGIWLDYTTFTIPFSVPLLFWISSFTHAVITGYFLGYVL